MLLKWVGGKGKLLHHLIPNSDKFFIEKISARRAINSKDPSDIMKLLLVVLCKTF